MDETDVSPLNISSVAVGIIVRPVVGVMMQLSVEFY